MKVKKIFALLLAGIMSVSVLAACGEDTPADETTTEAEVDGDEDPGTSDEEVTVRVALWDYSNLDYYKKMFEAFTTEHPNITIEPVEFAADEYETVVSTQLAGKQDFDVVYLKGLPYLSLLIGQGHLMSLNDFIDNDDEFNPDDYSGLLDAVTVDGETYAVPFRKDNNLLFYNKDLFDAAGVDYPTDGMTMAEFHDLATQMTSGEGNDKVYGAHMHTWASNGFMYARRTDEFTTIDTSTYPVLIPYYEELLAMQDEGVIQDYGAVSSSSVHYSGVMYNQQAAMLQMGTWFINMLLENAEFNWGVVTLPNNAGVDNELAVGGVTPVTIGAYAEHPEEAREVIKYVCGEEGAIILAENGVLPAFGSDAINTVFDSMHETNEYAPEGLSYYIDIDTYLVEQPMDPDGGDIDGVFTEEHSAIMTKSVSVEEGIQSLQERVDEIRAR